jgi:hypothetical protein
MILATLGNERWVMPMIIALGHGAWQQLRQVMSKINDIRQRLQG